ncbi:MAG: DUF4012 domain-containing protein [Actinomycetota bacterium]
MSSEPEASSRKAQRRRRSRWVGAGAGIALAIALATGLSALSAHDDLRAARDAMRRGRGALIHGDAERAATSFRDARERFDDVGSGAAGLVFRALGWIPQVGHTPRTTLAIAEAGSGAAEAGTVLADAVSGIPGGLASLSPANGGISVDRLVPLTVAVLRADQRVGDALATVRDSPDSLLIAPVRDARTLAEEELASLRVLLDTGSSLLQGLPGFLGTEGERRYFFAAQDPAELRGTGGVIGAYSILSIADGRFTFSPFRPIQSLPIPPLDEVPPPSEEYARNYGQFRGQERFWLAINLTPDFPTAAVAILNAYEVAQADSLDGVIFADPFALRALLHVAGPTVIPELGIKVTAGNVVPLVTNEAFSLFPGPEVRKRVLGAVASDVFDGFIRGPQPSLDDLRILGDALGEGHVLAYSTDPTMEGGLRGTGAGGALEARAGDFLSVVENSSAANKVDFYQDRSVSYEVTLDPDGSAHALTHVQLVNHAPTSGQPSYVIGPRPGISKVGESGQLLNVYCGPGCSLEAADRDGSGIALWTGSELGHTFYQDYFSTPSGETSDLSVSLFLPDAWQRVGGEGVYRLTVLSQVSVRPSDLRVEVVVPAGTHVTSTSPKLQVDGGSAIWQGTPTRRLELEVTFAP